MKTLLLITLMITTTACSHKKAKRSLASYHITEDEVVITEQAQQAKEIAQEYFNEQSYEESLEAFKEAFQFSPHHSFYINIIILENILEKYRETLEDLAETPPQYEMYFTDFDRAVLLTHKILASNNADIHDENQLLPEQRRQSYQAAKELFHSVTNEENSEIISDYLEFLYAAYYLKSEVKIPAHLH